MLFFGIAAASLGSCKKDETNYNITPKSQIIFDNDIDKVTADYQKSTTLNLRIGINGSANSVRITSTYSVIVGNETRPRSLDLGVFPVNAGVVMLSIPVTGLRAAADGVLVGAGPTPTTPAGLNPALYSRATNSYALVVDATAPDGGADRRFYTVVATQ